MKIDALSRILGGWLGACLVGGALTAGCAIMDSTITLEHQPVFDRAVANGRVFLAWVNDRRADQRRIGCKKNTGFSITESANVFLDVPLPDWFGGVLNEELRRVGLVLVGANDATGARVEVDLLDFFVEPLVPTGGFGSPTFYSLINAEVTVRFKDGTAFARRFASQTSESFATFAEGNYEEMIEGTMKGWLNQAVPEIARLIEARPAQASTGRLLAWRTVP
jgi:hypothetical protein